MIRILIAIVDLRGESPGKSIQARSLVLPRDPSHGDESGYSLHGDAPILKRDNGDDTGYGTHGDAPILKRDNGDATGYGIHADSISPSSSTSEDIAERQGDQTVRKR
ncbi:MAG: hypothetical protein Q9218_007851 [Villophora microphyllina]